MMAPLPALGVTCLDMFRSRQHCPAARFCQFMEMPHEWPNWNKKHYAAVESCYDDARDSLVVEYEREHAKRVILLRNATNQVWGGRAPGTWICDVHLAPLYPFDFTELPDWEPWEPVRRPRQPLPKLPGHGLSPWAELRWWLRRP